MGIVQHVRQRVRDTLRDWSAVPKLKAALLEAVRKNKGQGIDLPRFKRDQSVPDHVMVVALEQLQREHNLTVVLTDNSYTLMRSQAVRGAFTEAIAREMHASGLLINPGEKLDDDL